MFADACEKAGKFTRPIISACHRVDNTCLASLGAMVVINDEGWFFTALHIWRQFQAWQLEASAPAAHSQSRQVKRAAARTGVPTPGPNIRHAAIWLAHDGTTVEQAHFIEKVDLFLGKMKNFNPANVVEYPSFKSPKATLRQGVSLCRSGYPFSQVAVAYEEGKGFNFTRVSLSSFAIEGILSRNIKIDDNPAGYVNGLIETSSPGLKGQSGGPIFDMRGVVWGIQSGTTHHSLGFDPEAPDDGRGGPRRKEHQFLNAGVGAHPVTMAGLLHEKRIKHTLVD